MHLRLHGVYPEQYPRVLQPEHQWPIFFLQGSQYLKPGTEQTPLQLAFTVQGFPITGYPRQPFVAMGLRDGRAQIEMGARSIAVFAVASCTNRLLEWERGKTTSAKRPWCNKSERLANKFGLCWMVFHVRVEGAHMPYLYPFVVAQIVSKRHYKGRANYSISNRIMRILDG